MTVAADSRCAAIARQTGQARQMYRRVRTPPRSTRPACRVHRRRPRCRSAHVPLISSCRSPAAFCWNGSKSLRASSVAARSGSLVVPGATAGSSGPAASRPAGVRRPPRAPLRPVRLARIAQSARHGPRRPRGRLRPASAGDRSCRRAVPPAPVPPPTSSGVRCAFGPSWAVAAGLLPPSSGPPASNRTRRRPSRSAASLNRSCGPGRRAGRGPGGRSPR